VDAPVNGQAGFPEAERVLDYPTAPTAVEDMRVLLATVDELLQRINTPADSELGRLRTETRAALVAAQAAVATYAAQVRGKKKGYARASRARLDTYVRDRPGAIIGLTALVVLAIGFCAGRSAAKA
jgi:ElaB/YqjD/DUF883 family membrane-anchored ribosome-binding protein